MSTHRIDEVQVRRTGHRGGVILPHRSLLTLPMRWTAAVGSVLSVVMFTLAWWLVLPYVARTWEALARFSVEVLGLPAQVTIVERVSSWGFSVDVPQIGLAAAEPTLTQWWVGTFSCAVILALSLLLPRRHLPLIYWLRLVVMLQASSQFVFRMFPGGFPHDIASLTSVLFAAGFFLVALVPWIYGLTFYVLDFSLTKKILVTVLAMGHLFLFIPLQYVAHAYLIHHFSLLWMPILFWMFGLAVDVGIVIGFYGWAVSWQPLPYLRARYGEKHATASATVIALVLLLVAAPAGAERQYAIETGAGFTDYSGDLGDGNDQFVAFSAARRGVDRWRLDFGHAARFGDEGVGFGASYTREVATGLGLSAGLSTGTGEVIFPDLRLDLGLRRDGFLGTPAILRVGYTRLESKSENRSDGGEVGLFWPVGGGLDLFASERVELGRPGDTVSHSLNVGARYGRWRRWYVGASFRVGETSYVLIAPDDPRVDFSSRSWTFDATWYVRQDRGLSLRYEHFDSDVYDLRGVGLRAFLEW